VLLVSDRVEVYADRLLELGATLFLQPAAPLESAPGQVSPGAGAPFALVLWLDGGPESPRSPEFERSLVFLTGMLAPDGWLGLALAPPEPEPVGPDDPEADGWGRWATTLWSCGLTVHDVRVTQHVGGPGVRLPAWLRPFPGFAYRLDRGLVMSGLRLGGSGPRLVMARRSPTIDPSGNP
jgi:hypothetical protein